MNITLTVADVATILLLVMAVAAILAHWPQKGDNSGPGKKEHKFTMGTNAMRIGWDATRGEHEMCIELRRPTDVLPGIGEIVTFVEEGGDSFRGKIVDVPIVSRISGQNTKVVIVVVPFIRERVYA